jgi:hypothetical protein
LLQSNGGTFISGSTAYSGEDWTNANDGDIDDWDGTVTASTAVSPIQAIYSFNSPKTISKINILVDTNVGYSDRWLNGFKLEVAATDTGAYTTVLTGIKKQTSGFQSYSFTPIVAKRIRITATSNYGGKYLQIGEVEIYGY